MMKQGNRTVWSAGDYRRACAELERLLKLRSIGYESWELEQAGPDGIER